MNSKRILANVFFIGVFVVMASLVTNSVFATTDNQPKRAKGKVKTSANANAAGASVSATCNGHTVNGTTNGSGNYELVFASGDCHSGDLVTVVASLNGESGQDSEHAGNGSNVEFSPPIVMAAVSSVPEFGLIPGIVAVMGSAGAFFALKKSQHKV